MDNTLVQYGVVRRHAMKAICSNPARHCEARAACGWWLKAALDVGQGVVVEVGRRTSAASNKRYEAALRDTSRTSSRFCAVMKRNGVRTLMMMLLMRWS